MCPERPAEARRRTPARALHLQSIFGLLKPPYSDYIGVMIESFWNVLLELSPWLLLGMAVAGLLHMALPPGFIRRHLRGRAGVVRAVALGVPLPLCSCGVIPAGIGLKRDGASDGAAVGFLISTPQTGVDSVLVSASMLGWPFAILKVIAALMTGLVGGLWVDRLGGPEAEVDGAGAEEHVDRSLMGGLRQGLDILDGIWMWVVFGVVASALITVWVPAGTLSGMSTAGGLLAALAALAVAVPLYVCATASVPIAAALVAAGMPVGAALVFLMAGPATNVATMGAIYKTFGGKKLAAYLAVIILGSTAFGLGFDFLLDADVARAALHGHEHTSPVAAAAAVALLALLAWFAGKDALRLWRHLRRGSAGGATVALTVEGMTCKRCAARLEGAIYKVEGVDAATVELEAGRLEVIGRVDLDAVRKAVEDAGFTPS